MIHSIEIKSASAFVGAFYVSVNDDDETARACINYREALAEVEQIVFEERERLETQGPK